MPQYKSYEDWQRKQQSRFKQQIESQLPETRIGEPLDYPTRKIGETPEPGVGFADKNALYDFIGNS